MIHGILVTILFFSIFAILSLSESLDLIKINDLLFIPLYLVAGFISLLFVSYRFLLRSEGGFHLNLLKYATLAWITTTAIAAATIRAGGSVNYFLWNILLAGTLFFISLMILLSVSKKSSGEATSTIRYPYIYTVIILTIVGFLLRIYHLDYTTPLTDEFYHLLAAKRYLFEGYFEYTRGIFITYAVGFIFKLLNDTSIYFARLVPVILGTATIPLMYLLWRRIHPSLGLLSATLLSLMPLAIGMSRFIREYSFFLLYLVGHFILLFYTLSHIHQRFTYAVSGILLLMLPPISFYLFIEDSNFVPLLIIFTFIAIIITSLHEISFSTILKKFKRHRFTFSVAGTFLLAGLIYFYTRLTWLIHIRIPDSFFALPDLNYFDALFSPSYSPWGVHYFWFSGSSFPTFFVLGLCFCGVLLFWKNRYYQTAWGIFLITLIPFLYFADRYYAIRYIYYIIPFYVLIVASGIYAIFYGQKIFSNNIHRVIYLASIIFIGSTFFSISPTFAGLEDEISGATDPKKELHSYDYPALFSTLDKLGFKDGDPIIASDGINNGIAYYLSNYKFIRERARYPLLRYALKPQGENLVSFNDMHEIYAYHYDVSQYYAYPCADNMCAVPEEERIQALMQEQVSGWFIVDKDRNKNWNPNGFPLQDFMLGDVSINYLGSTEGFRGIDIYRWVYSPKVSQIQ